MRNEKSAREMHRVREKVLAAQQDWLENEE